MLCSRPRQTLHMHHSPAVLSLMRDMSGMQEQPHRMTEEEMRLQVQGFLLDDSA